MFNYLSNDVMFGMEVLIHFSLSVSCNLHDTCSIKRVLKVSELFVTDDENENVFTTVYVLLANVSWTFKSLRCTINIPDAYMF